VSEPQASEPLEPGRPRVTVGLPVHNGENYIAETLSCFLGQTFTDLEVVVSDNASADRTREIVESFAARDARVRYVRQATNVGGAENYNVVFHEARGEYFTWTAHDDLRSPGWVEQAVAALDAHPDAALAISDALRIDSQGRPFQTYPIRHELYADAVCDRFRAALRQNPILMIFGMARSDAIRRTCLHEHYTGSDWGVTGGLALQGRVVHMDDATFYYRVHKESLTSRYAGRMWWQRSAFEAWFAPERGGRIVFPSWRRLRSYVRSILAAPVPRRARLRLLGTLARTFMVDDRAYLAKLLLKDVLVAIRDLVRRPRPHRPHPPHRPDQRARPAGPDQPPAAPASNR
jgi:glycosyltransferase involved in cell wall biosynthesis